MRELPFGESFEVVVNVRYYPLGRDERRHPLPDPFQPGVPGAFEGAD